ncbi:Myb-like DNA-binding domain-containing protein [Spironucleus salmonicida]|uniref:Myb-like DNA-binding domain-containing protein n=1 Tax=Spironucleus salmonicida TaxID=348837 RepID=V6LTH8_9EUKA|nr:Myb-like DNA-binding domain-containing protein [Spironucleus salmonicida]|eukprot:EST47558.1 Myb-like DNA-binding domain-containing protein [Spironucleus salmonicida]
MAAIDPSLNSLVSLVKSNRKPCNTIDWYSVQGHFPMYTKIELQNKFYGYLRKHKQENPDLVHNHKWTEQEKAQILSLVKIHGKNWSIIQNYFPDLTLIQLKNKYQQLRQKPGQDRSLADLCNELSIQLIKAEKLLEKLQ